jgi:hypothetical protein
MKSKNLVLLTSAVLIAASCLLNMVAKTSTAAGAEAARDGRFVAYDDGTVLDSKTHLMWAAKDNGKDIGWTDAVTYCEKFRGGGYSNWRMPTDMELAGLYDKAKTYKVDEPAYKGDVHLTKLIRITNMFIWSSNTRGSDASSSYYQQDGGGLWMPKSLADSHRALPVRPVESSRR